MKNVTIAYSTLLRLIPLNRTDVIMPILDRDVIMIELDYTGAQLSALQSAANEVTAEAVALSMEAHNLTPERAHEIADRIEQIHLENREYSRLLSITIQYLSQLMLRVHDEENIN